MKKLKVIRIILSVLFLLASVAYLTLGASSVKADAISFRFQIIPSMLGTTIGVTLFWIMVTILFGRIYCSSVCPLGTFQDIIIRLWHFIPAKKRSFRFRKTHRYRYDILVVYIICLIVGNISVPLIIEPWNIFSNIMSLLRPDVSEARWIQFGLYSFTGIIAGAFSLALITVTSLLSGRSFCNEICPIGTALALIGSRSRYHIEIDPDKCISCLKCEDVCKGECIKVISRYVDDSNCIRCFNCISVCEDDAIRFQINRNRPASPMMRKVRNTTGK